MEVIAPGAMALATPSAWVRPSPLLTVGLQHNSHQPQRTLHQTLASTQILVLGELPQKQLLLEVAPITATLTGPWSTAAKTYQLLVTFHPVDKVQTNTNMAILDNTLLLPTKTCNHPLPLLHKNYVLDMFSQKRLICKV